MPEEHSPSGPPPENYRFIDRRESLVDRDAWHLSKSVPLAFVIALLIQTTALVSWAVTFRAEFVAYRNMTTKQFSDLKDYIDSKTGDRITAAEVRAELRTRDYQLNVIERKDSEILGEVRRIQSSIQDRLGRIEAKIDKHVEVSTKFLREKGSLTTDGH